MRRKRRNPNTPYIALILVLAVVLVVLLLSMDQLIGPGNQPTSGESAPTTSTPDSSTPSSSVVNDTKAPVIEGAKDLEVYTDSTVSYKAGVTVTDDMDTKPALTIDNSKVNLSKPGVYEVVYTATDASGNSTSVTIKLTVKAKPDPAGVLFAMKECGGVPEETLYVGDSEVDIITAKNAGMTSIGVAWGFRDAETLKAQDADYVVYRAEEIFDIANG